MHRRKSLLCRDSSVRTLRTPDDIKQLIMLLRLTGPDSVMVRAFASEAGGADSNPGRVIPKTLKMVPVATLLGAQH